MRRCPPRPRSVAVPADGTGADRGHPAPAGGYALDVAGRIEGMTTDDYRLPVADRFPLLP